MKLIRCGRDALPQGQHQSQRVPQERPMRQEKFRGNVFVANLPDGYTDAKLAEAFDPYGIVIGAYLARDPESGALKRYGLVNIAPGRAAAAAIADLNGKNINGRQIEVRVADPDMGLTMPSRRRSSSKNAEFGAHAAFIVERRPVRRRP
jgi:RNA recognition motif-containing protein